MDLPVSHSFEFDTSCTQLTINGNSYPRTPSPTTSMLKRIVAAVAIPALILAGLIWLLAKPTTTTPPQLTAAPLVVRNSSTSEQATSTADSTIPASFTTTTQTASSNPQCAEGERLITIPTSPEFTVDETPFCSKLGVGPTFASPDAKWTAAIESIPGTDIQGRLSYQLLYGPGLWEADHNLFILFTNRSTGDQREFGIARAVLQGDVMPFAEGQERVESGIAAWSRDGKQLWGWATFSTNADAGVGDSSAQPLQAAFFEIDVNTWQAESSLIPVPADRVEVGVSQKLSDALNADRNMALYGEIIGTSTVSLNIYDFATHTTTSVASFPGDFETSGCDPNSTSALFCQTETNRLGAHWVNSSTVSWVDPRTGELVIRSIL